MYKIVIEEAEKAVREELEKIAQAKIQPVHNVQPVHHDNVHTNNCWGNIDYSPLAPTDKLNVKISPSMATALTAGAITAVVKDPATAFSGLSIAIPSIMVGDSVRGEPSFSMSITGHHGETFGHLDFPH